MATALFEKQLKKGRVGELAFQKMALKHFGILLESLMFDRLVHTILNL